MKKIFQQIHLWLSVPFGVIIALICFSGAMLVFEKEVMELSTPKLYYVEKVGNSTLPLDELAEKVASILPDSVQVTGITVFSNPKRTYQVNLSKPRRASMYIDPYTGEVKGKYERASFFTTMFKMHRWLMGSARAEDGSMGWGKLTVGFSTLIFIIALITGVVIWWPRNRKVLRNRLSIQMKKGWRRFWYDLHVVGGIYAFLFLLAMALTGLTWSFQWYRNGVYSMLGGKVPQGRGDHIQPSNTQERVGQKISREQVSPYLHWQQIYEELAAKNPDFKQIAVSKGSANVSFERWGNQRASDKYTFDPLMGTITESTLYKDIPNSGKISGWIYSVHVGTWGGLLTRILTFLSALLGATLPLTGYYLWIKRTFRFKKRQA